MEEHFQFIPYNVEKVSFSIAFIYSLCKRKIIYFTRFFVKIKKGGKYSK